MITTKGPIRRGFASVLAVALIALVAIALSAMAAVMHVEVRQAIAANADVQLRQLLLAGEPFAIAALSDAQGEKVSVALPAALTENGGRLTFEVQRKGDTAEVTVRAVYGGYLRSQVLRCAKERDRWMVKGAALLPLQRA